MNVAVVGAGTVGSVMGKVLSDRGEKVVCVVSRSLKSARRAGKFLKCRNVSTSLAAIPPKADLIYISTPHHAVGEVAHKLAAVVHLRFRELAVCHASGMLTAEVLTPLAQRGATVFSFHPLQTFPRDFAVNDIVPTARGIYYAIDGDKKGIAAAERLARKLSGKTIIIKPEMRAFYHATCVVAANHLATLLWMVKQMHGVLKTKEKDYYPVFAPIIQATLRNVAATSPEQALTGPVARGGVETISEHLESIQRFAPDLVPYYARLTNETLRLAEAKGSVNKEQARAMRTLIHGKMGRDT